MSESINGELDLGKLREDITVLKRDVSNLMRDLKASANGHAQSAAAQLDEGARELYRSVAAEAERSAKAIGRQVEEQPLMSLLIAAGVGYISGRLLSR